MRSREITITSKNQVTLPADYVRKLGLSRSRIMKAELKANQIILTVEPGLSEQMERFWGKQAPVSLTDDELKAAIRQSGRGKA